MVSKALSLLVNLIHLGCQGILYIEALLNIEPFKLLRIVDNTIAVFLSCIVRLVNFDIAVENVKVNSKTSLRFYRKKAGQLTLDRYHPFYYFLFK